MTTAHGQLDERLIKAEQCTLIWSEPRPGGGREVVKMYRRRPLADPVRRWFIPYRVEREFGLLAHLARHGVACPEPLGWSHGHIRTHGRYELLATREIADTIPLAHWLRQQDSQMDLGPLFQLARRMHECGISHGAFYPANILVTTAAQPVSSFHVIDLAHGCLFPRSIVGTRPALFDLLDMLRGIARKRALGDCTPWLAAYGLNLAEIQRLLTRLAHHRLERPWRHIRRAETDARAVWHRLARRTASAAASRASG